MYNQIIFSNYKIFKSKQCLDIRPLTILFGKNNAGKSAILKLPLLIENSLKGKSEEVTMQEFNGEALYADIRDLVYRRGTKALGVELRDENQRKLKYSFYVDAVEEVKSHIESWEFEYNGKRYALGDNLVCEFKGVIPQLNDTLLENEIKSMRMFIDYIGSVRTDVGRDIRQGTITECSGWRGDKGYAHLLKDALTSSRLLIGKVSAWYEKTFPGWKIDVDATGNPVFHINVSNEDVQTNIVDAGFGITQSLPIIIRICRPCPNPSLLIFEEPEAHLNPAAQGNLGELIARSTKEDSNKRYLIETHSYNFILRIRSLIAEGVLDKNDVALYYIGYNDEEKSSALRRVDIDEKGVVSNWPKDMFEDTYEEVVRLRNAQRKSEE
ncbi:MAG: DUF3696 domain-containing protein [Paludibacteraceae bacterium]|nr:DUF3696 domain-containing protein [Paludibacteraceae bacterium]